MSSRKRKQESNEEVRQQARSTYTRDEYRRFGERVPVLVEHRTPLRWFPSNEFDNDEYDANFQREVRKIELEAEGKRRVKAYKEEEDLAMQSSSSVVPYSMGPPNYLLGSTALNPCFDPSKYEGRDERHYYKQLADFYERQLVEKNAQIQVLQEKVLDLTIDLESSIVEMTKIEDSSYKRITKLETQLHSLNIHEQMTGLGVTQNRDID